jgi:four helix bundle protein
MRHTQTRLYQRSLELIEVAKSVMEQLPTGYGFLADQLRRASSSVVLNFSEGSSRSSIRERRRYFQIARGSALEVSAILDVAARFDAIDGATHSRGVDLCDHLSAMLFKYR